MRLWIVAMLCVGLMGADYSPRRGIRSAAGGGGGTCTGSTNWVETATHAYAITDSSWAVAGDPEDECDQHGASCTPVDLETSTGLTDGDDVKTATPPSGSNASAVYWDLNNATTEVAKTASRLRVSSNYQDWSFSAWVKITACGGSRQIYTETNNEFASRAYISTNGSCNVTITTESDGGDTTTITSTGTVSTGTWFHVAVALNSDGVGSPAFGDAGSLFINGVTDGTSSSMEDDAVTTTTGHVSIAPQSNATADIQIHEMLFFNGTVLTEANAHQICCCGAATDALATTASRDSICGGTACTSL